ncbi:hypothetical protein [Psychrobacter celer]|uniref:hypothetical protein n=1 Tax=Psychrobacter celer TaxID=306572 RepID=UPI003FD1A212
MIGAVIIQSISKDDIRVRVTVQTAIRHGSPNNLAVDAIHLVDYIRKNMNQYAVNVSKISHANGVAMMHLSMALTQSMDESARFVGKAILRKRKHAKSAVRIKQEYLAILNFLTTMRFAYPAIREKQEQPVLPVGALEK